MMHGREKSDSAIVARKPTNKAVLTAAEPVERRAGAKGNANQQSTDRAQNRATVSQALERVRQVSPSHTQSGSRVREFRSHGSGRGAVSNDLNCLPPSACLAFVVARDASSSVSLGGDEMQIGVWRAKSCCVRKSIPKHRSRYGKENDTPRMDQR